MSRLHRHARYSVFALALVLAACGSSESDTSKSTPAPGGSKGSTAAPGKSAGGTGKGTIQIGDLNHDLTVTRCTSMAGALGGDAVSVSEPDNVDVTFSFYPEDWADRPKSEGWDHDGDVRLDSEDPYLQWVSGPDHASLFQLPDNIKIDDVTITNYDISDDGQSVSGEAKFIEVNTLGTERPVVLTDGTFSFSCPPKG